MNKEEYIEAVKNELGFMPRSEVIKAEEYFRSFFGGGKSDEEIIADLGTPKSAAQKYFVNRQKSADGKKNFEKAPQNIEKSVKNTQKNGEKTPKKNDFTGIVILVVAAVFLFPIWLPALIGSAALVFALLVCVIALSFGMWIGGGVVITGGLLSNISIADKLLQCGSGFIMFGVGLVLSWLLVWALINLCVWIIRKITHC